MLVLLFLYKHGITLPDNPTDLYKQFISLTLCRNLAKLGITCKQVTADLQNLPDPCGEIIQQLSRLSLDKLNSNQLVFTLDEIKGYCPQLETIPGAINGFGLLQAVEHIDIFQAIKTFHFIHFSVQEYLAAHCILCLPPQEEYKILDEYFWSDIHHNMFNFYVSLTKGQSPSFKQYLCSGSEATFSIADKFLKNKMKRLRLYHCFYEADDKQMCHTIEKTFSDGVIKFPVPLSPSDLLDVTTMLTCSSIKQWKMLEFGNCHIQDNGVRLLHRSLMNSGVSIHELRLYNNDLTSSSDSFLSDIVISCKVKVLNVGFSKAVGESKHFMLLSKPSTALEVLYMYDNEYSSAKWAEQLFTSLMTNKSLKKLWVDNNNITDEICVFITKALLVNNTLNELYMGNNRITGEAAQELIKALKENNALQVLRLPKYPENITKVITDLQEVVNENRKEHGCDKKLEIKFPQF
ncbi:ribonuclease inhibitor-like [Dysidea avara]|uniref:ribonuclease inhibitor-like n=1 Tax=Dysidea avara TaxID=196820 RepID=UPI0033338EE2